MKVARSISFDLEIAQAIDAQGKNASAFVNRAVQTVLDSGATEAQTSRPKAKGKSLNKHMEEQLQLKHQQQEEGSTTTEAIASVWKEKEAEEALETGLDNLRRAFSTPRKDNRTRLQHMVDQVNILCVSTGLNPNIIMEKAWPEGPPEAVRMYARQQAAGH